MKLIIAPKKCWIHLVAVHVGNVNGKVKSFEVSPAFSVNRAADDNLD